MSGGKLSLPEIQVKLLGLADDLYDWGYRPESNRLRKWVRQMSRQRNKLSARSKKPMPTPKKVLAVREYFNEHPRVSYTELDDMFKVGNIGRVSEILFDKLGEPMYDKKGERI